MEKYRRNPIFHSISSQSTNKFRSIMNSPNFGNQQILLQSCCFFDSEKSQTPHASHTLIKELNVRQKNRAGSPKISYSNRNLGSYKKFHFIIDNSKESNENTFTTNDNRQMVEKLKKDNKALKETIKNLTSQLDRVYNIALKAKNNEMNTIQKNNDNLQEKNILLNKIENLKKEKNELKVEIVKKDEEYHNFKLKNKINEINNKNKIIDNENKRRKFINDIANEFENIKQKNNTLSISVNKEKNDNKQYKMTIKKLNEENELLKDKIEEQINTLNKNLNDKEKDIQNLIEENLNLRTKINNFQKRVLSKEQVDDIYNNSNNNFEKEKDRLIKENKNLSNKLIEAGKTISEYIRKYGDISKKYFNIKNLSKKLEKTNNDLIIKLSMQNNNEGNNNKSDDNNNYIFQKNYETLIKEKNDINLNYNKLKKEYDIIKEKYEDNIETINRLKNENKEYINDNTLLSTTYLELKKNYDEVNSENDELKNKIVNLENVNNKMIKRLDIINVNYNESDKNIYSEKYKKNKIIGKNNIEDIKIQYKLLLYDYNNLKREYQKIEDEINSKNLEYFRIEKQNNNLQENLADLEEKYNRLINENKILLEKYNSLENNLINLNNENASLQKDNDNLNQLCRELKIKFDDLSNKNISEKSISKDKKEIGIVSLKSISSKNIVGKLKQDLFLSNQKYLELKKYSKKKIHK